MQIDTAPFYTKVEIELGNLYISYIITDSIGLTLQKVLILFLEIHWLKIFRKKERAYHLVGNSRDSTKAVSRISSPCLCKPLPHAYKHQNFNYGIEENYKHCVTICNAYIFNGKMALVMLLFYCAMLMQYKSVKSFPRL